MNKHVICEDCNRTFIVPEWEQSIFKANGKLLPKICSTCRKERRIPKSRFTEDDYRFWISIMTNRIPVRRDTKHPTDDFRGFMNKRTNRVS